MSLDDCFLDLEQYKMVHDFLSVFRAGSKLIFKQN